MKHIKVPFKDLGPENRQNLAIAALAAAYVIKILLDVYWHNLFGGLAADFTAYWSAGYIANHYGYAQVYDLELMTKFQTQLFPGLAGSSLGTRIIPVPYLPVYILPFQLLARLRPDLAYWAWSAFNFLGTFFYMLFLNGKARKTRSVWRPVLFAMVSLPVFLNLYEGQYNLLLTVCIGEFMRAILAGNPMRGGLWLAGLLLKPQILPLICLALLLQRAFKSFIGLAISSSAILLVSIWFAGASGLLKLARLWLGYASGLPTNNPEAMMNWRMLGTQLGGFLDPRIGWTVAGAGIIVTTGAVIHLWMRPYKPDPSLIVIILAGTLAAINLTAWHAHNHMAMVLLPPLTYLYHSRATMFKGMLERWILLPALIFFGTVIFTGLTSAYPALSSYSTRLLNVLPGMTLFAFNLYILCWSILQLREEKGGVWQVQEAP